MQKSYLFDLISVVRGVLDENDLPIIVGSQSIFAQTDDPPRIVRESRECDFLLFGGKAAERIRSIAIMEFLVLSLMKKGTMPMRLALRR